MRLFSAILPAAMSLSLSPAWAGPSTPARNVSPAPASPGLPPLLPAGAMTQGPLETATPLSPPPESAPHQPLSLSPAIEAAPAPAAREAERTSAHFPGTPARARERAVPAAEEPASARDASPRDPEAADPGGLSASLDRLFDLARREGLEPLEAAFSHPAVLDLSSRLLPSISPGDVIAGASMDLLKDIHGKGRITPDHESSMFVEDVQKARLDRGRIFSARNAVLAAARSSSEPAVIRIKPPRLDFRPLALSMHGVRTGRIEIFDPAGSRWVLLKTLAKLNGWTQERDPDASLPRSERARREGLLALAHATSLRMLPFIAEDGGLLSFGRAALSGRIRRLPLPPAKKMAAFLSALLGGPGGFGMGGHGGVFLTALRKNDLMSTLWLDPAKRHAVLVFSLDPLDRRDYHANADWGNLGRRTADSFRPKGVMDLVKSIVSRHALGPGQRNEFVFSRWRKFPLTHLREIWVAPEDVDETVAALEDTRFQLPPGTSWRKIVVGRTEVPDRLDSPPLGSLIH